MSLPPATHLTSDAALASLVADLARLMPPAALAAILARLARRLDELKATGQGASLELHIHIKRGAFWEARWDPDERIDVDQGCRLKAT